MEAAQKHWFLPRKRLDFQARGHQNPPEIGPNPIKMRSWRPRAGEKRFRRPSKPILNPKIAIFEAKRAILDPKMDQKTAPNSIKIDPRSIPQGSQKKTHEILKMNNPSTLLLVFKCLRGSPFHQKSNQNRFQT